MFVAIGTGIGAAVVYAVGRIILGVINNWDEVFKPRGQYYGWWKLACKAWQEYRRRRAHGATTGNTSGPGIKNCKSPASDVTASNPRLRSNRLSD